MSLITLFLNIFFKIKFSVVVPSCLWCCAQKMTDTSPGRALGIYTRLGSQRTRAREAEITFRAWAPSQGGAGAKLPSDPKCALFPHHKTENYCFMVIRPIIMYFTGMCTIEGNRRRMISVIQRLRTGDRVDFYCYNCLTFHWAENTVLCQHKEELC